MKLFNAQQIREWDQATIIETPISSIELMEKAAIAFTDIFKRKYTPNRPVSVFCGMGNNGGDGLAIARILSMAGYDVRIWLADFGQDKSNDFLINLNRLPDFDHIPMFAVDMAEPPMLSPDELVIDALLGTGINRPVEGALEDLIHWLNSLHHTIVSVDIPSGLYADADCETAIKANHTITFQIPKISFLLPSYEQYTGTWETVDIGLIKGFAARTPSRYYLSEIELIRTLINKRKKFSHKGTYGHALLINGSYGKGGAAILAAKACLRSGVGLLTNHIPSNLYNILQTSVPEAMASLDEHEFYWSSLPKDIRKYTAIGVGCGIDQKESTERALLTLLSENDSRMVLDADAINLLARHPDWLHKLPAGTILTPHIKEFERLFGPSKSCFDRVEKLRKNACDYNLIIVLKGAHSAIGLPDGHIYFNNTGNPGMATAGTGDVLTGILTGLVAQGYDSQSAALIGTFIHGFAGDLAYKDSSYESLIASDIIKYMGHAFHTIFHG
ncbi:MAG: NAD(P)H-hydrate dehydratase [Saprospiraceae bacterium]|nr:NAD(P)H-hydrate dehydratase [Saprospiraceae bacterium]MBK6816545.1 NAD(P)H-hydrate dehydratase [Saprospiraceae bacterium]MBK7609426.1 NAD(P)H-hydrate dehydratase [Saprospiraceae bacterium]MBP8941373.1 NAD(P)H-hydrate dehydratase [Saprospiraceae bacterium]